MPSTEPSSLQDIQALQANLVPLQPLDLKAKQIRILHLLPGQGDDPIRCELYPAYLSDQPYYEALSYVWGDPKVVKPIFLEDRQVQVTTNLEAALRALRLREETRHMWVDALCINQTDDAEKTHQVNLMSEIYKGTALALLWLGSITADAQEYEDEESGSKISYIDAANAFDFIRKAAEAGDDGHFVFDEDSREAGAIQATLDSCYALWRLVGLSWWHRIWTVQEAVLPRKAIILCDSLKLDWSTFVMASKTIKKHDEKECCIDLSSAQGLYLLSFWSSVNQIEYCRGTHLKLIDALRVHNKRTAGDSRDYLYALLGLDTDWGAQLSVLVDYSLSPQEVFYRMTTELIRLSNNLTPLIRLRQPSTDALLPTWVNDLSAAADSSGVIFQRYDRYSASKGMALSVGFSPQRELKSRGILVDEVERISDPYDLTRKDEIYRQWIGLLELDDVKGRNRPYPTGRSSYLEAFHRLISDGLDRDFSVADWLDGVVSFYESKNIWNSCLFITKKNLIGLGYKHMRVGDMVHVLFGGNYPFLLRPIKEGRDKGCYTYIGHCYVQGIMHGEAVQDDDKGEVFTIV